MARTKYVDVAKGLSILAVVLWHIRFSFDLGALFPLKTLLGGLWHVPVFFAISGFFLKDEKLLCPRSFIMGKLKTLYLWTLCFYIPAVLLHNVFFDIGFYSSSVSYGGKEISIYSSIDFVKQILAVFLFAGREPIVGALWFSYVLLLSLFAYSVITWICKRICKNADIVGIRMFLCVFFAVVSCVLSNKMGLTLNRFSNTLVVTAIICFGQYLFQKRNVQFDSVFVFAVSIVLSWQCAVLSGNVFLNNNSYHDFFHLFGGCFCMLYVVCFISKKIESFYCGKVLAYIGKKSFYIMALHLVAFKLGAILLNVLGWSVNIDAELPSAKDSVVLVAYYLVVGTAMPLLFAFLWEKIRNFWKGHFFPLFK